MPNTINETEWLSQKLNTQCLCSISSVLNFSIFWNLFEDKYFSSDYNPSKIAQMFFAKQKDISRINDDTIMMLNFFKYRYYGNGYYTYNFSSLNLRRSDDEVTIKSVLEGRENSDEKIFKTVITIIGRFRNNLFHGLKSPSEIVIQNEIFSYLNCYL